MKINNLIVCKDARGSESLKYGATYRIEAINQHGNLGISEYENGICQPPLQHFYKQNRFELFASNAKIIDINKEYKTRNGRIVKLLVISDSPSYPIVGQILDNNIWYNESWKINGMCYDSESSDDLVEVILVPNRFETSNCIAKFYNDGSILLEGMVKTACPTLSKKEFPELLKAYENFNSQT